MRPLSAEFVTSVISGGVLPADDLPLIALVGRSNVGKSSLINALVKRRIARSGAKPGTTRLLNLYHVATSGPQGRTFLIADLPGYGYARGGSQAQQEFGELTSEFFDQMDRVTSEGSGIGPRLAGVILVVDIRHPGLESDVAARTWIRARGYNLAAIVTKADRITRSRRQTAHLRHIDALDCPVELLSTRTGEGIGKAWREILRLL